MRVVHEGRTGYVEIEGIRYDIEHLQRNQFCVHFPSGRRHAKLQMHLNALKKLAESQKQVWQIHNRSHMG